jgi:hypothetical protein
MISKSDGLMNGPQSTAVALTQADIDKLLKG